MKYLFGLKLINMSERVAYFPKIAERSFAEKSKQNHGKSPIFRLTLRLFRAGKQRNRNKVTHLETGFPKILMKNMFSFHLKNCFCCYDKRKLLNLNRFQFAFCA